MPRKVFTAGEVLAAADVNEFLMDQAVQSFAGTAARGSAIPSPVEGMVTYLSSNEAVEVYNGSVFKAVGKIVQVVSTAKTDTFTLSSTSFSDVTGLSASITPTSTASKILVMLTLNAGSNVGTVNIRGRLLRGATDIALGDAAGSRVSVTFAETSSQFEMSPLAMNFLDSPATTSAVTYKVQVSGNAASLISINRAVSDGDAATTQRGISTITLMEVAD
jgi:hypothetical protein